MNVRAADILLDRALAGGSRSVAVVGTAKNVGKTVCIAALVEAAARRGIPFGLVSSGRDGEAADALDGRAKPRLRLPAGAFVATARHTLPRSPSVEVYDVGERSAVGAIAVVRMRAQTCCCEIVGPPTAAALRRSVARLHACGAHVVFIDGAVDRIAALAGGDDATIVATGAASGATVAGVAARAADAIARLAIPRYDERRDGEALQLEGALGYERAAELTAAGERRAIVIADPTRVTIRGGAFARVAERLRIRVLHAQRVVACAVASSDGVRVLEPRALVEAVARAAALPAFDLYANLAAG